jgi:S1-C subfamily serine protease
MRHIVGRVLVVVFVLALSPTSWNIERIAPSLARLTIEGHDGACTAFAIHEKKGRWVTMTHCVPETPARLRLNGSGKLLEVLAATPGNVGITVFAATLTAPGLKLGNPPKRGDDLLQIGYGAGAPIPLFYHGLFIDDALTTTTQEATFTVQFNSVPGMPGMSGGPLLDRKYRVVGVISGGVQLTDVPTMVSFSPVYSELKALLEKFGQ